MRSATPEAVPDVARGLPLRAASDQASRRVDQFGVVAERQACRRGGRETARGRTFQDRAIDRNGQYRSAVDLAALVLGVLGLVVVPGALSAIIGCRAVPGMVRAMTGVAGIAGLCRGALHGQCHAAIGMEARGIRRGEQPRLERRQREEQHCQQRGPQSRMSYGFVHQFSRRFASYESPAPRTLIVPPAGSSSPSRFSRSQAHANVRE